MSVTADPVPLRNCGSPVALLNHAERPAAIVGVVPFFVIKWPAVAVLGLLKKCPVLFVSTVMVMFPAVAPHVRYAVPALSRRDAPSVALFDAKLQDLTDALACSVSMLESAADVDIPELAPIVEIPELAPLVPIYDPFPSVNIGALFTTLPIDSVKSTAVAVKSSNAAPPDESRRTMVFAVAADVGVSHAVAKLVELDFFRMSFVDPPDATPGPVAPVAASFSVIVTASSFSVALTITSGSFSATAIVMVSMLGSCRVF